MLFLASLLVALVAANPCQWNGRCTSKMATAIADKAEQTANTECMNKGLTDDKAGCEGTTYDNGNKSCKYLSDMTVSGRALYCASEAFAEWYASDEYKKVTECTAKKTEDECTGDCQWSVAVCSLKVEETSAAKCGAKKTKSKCDGASGDNSSAAAIGVSFAALLGLAAL